MRKPTICICENKDADQLRGNREADQRLCFLYTDSTLPLLFKSEISSFQSASVTVQPDLCRTCSETTLLVFPRGGSYFLYVTTLIFAVFSYHFHGHPPKVIPKQVYDWRSWSEIFVFHDSRDVIQAKSAVQGIPIADRYCYYTQNDRVDVERMSRSVLCFTHDKSRTAEILNEYEIS